MAYVVHLLASRPLASRRTLRQYATSKGPTDAMTSLPTIARVARALPLVGAAGIAAYGLLSSVGVLGGLLLVVILLLAAALGVWARSDLDAKAVLARTANAGLLCAPAALIVFFSFSSGGFFPDSVATGVLSVAFLLVVRLGVAARPLSTFGRGALAPLTGLIGLSGWALLSQVWSHAPGRAAVGFDRDLLYLLTFALFASVGRTRERLAWAVRTVAFAMAAVAAISLI